MNRVVSFDALGRRFESCRGRNTAGHTASRPAAAEPNTPASITNPSETLTGFGGVPGWSR